MRIKNNYFYTLRENVKDEDSTSGNLLVKSGMIKKVGAGIYMYLPIGLKAFNNVQKVVKEEMNKAGALELLMPSLIPQEIYESSGRVNIFGSSIFKLTDRNDRPMVLGPTHEEVFTIAAKGMVRSYKDLPFTLYQSADKFRDEPRSRYGLVRVREFFMKDAYSFDKDEEQLDESYMKMFNAYKNIFDRLKVNYKIVRSSTGAMGGSLSEEFQALTDLGEDILVLCDSCDYASNIDIATSKKIATDEEEKELELVETPESKTIEEVSKLLNVPVEKTVKAMLMRANDELVTFFLRGDRELNETKVCKLFNINELAFADDALIATSNAVPGFTGPVGLNSKIVIDKEVLGMKNFVVGANKEGYHYKNCNVKDFKYDIVEDISSVKEGDICPHCGGKIYFKKGIEIGNTFKLGTKYAKSLGLTYLDEFNKPQYVTMGCYGIGIGRVLASIVEQNNDEKGIIFPMTVAPFKVCIVPSNMKDEHIVETADKIYQTLTESNIDTIYDDRDERLGVKFNDMDLIGIPIRITVGKKLAENKVELKLRKEDTSKDVDIENIIDEIKNIIEKES
mgnify:FL=1